jgi:hypothetical protein
MNSSKQKKTKQLGMDPALASYTLRNDLLFAFVKISHPFCFRCGEILTRDTFSVDHKVHWLDSPDPKGLFFDLENIAYSHLSCNSKASRNPQHTPHLTDEERHQRKLGYQRKWREKHYTSEKRAEKYKRTGT